MTHVRYNKSIYGLFQVLLAVLLSCSGPEASFFESVKKNNAGRISVMLKDNPGLAGARSATGQTALMYAAYYCSPEIIRLLLDSGADIGSRDSDGRTPLHWAAGNGAPRCIKLLKERGAEPDPGDNSGNTPLMIACSNSKGAAAAAALIESGANVNLANKAGRTPLMMAACWNCMDSAFILLKNGAAVNARDSRGWTPLVYAADKNRGEGMVKLFLDNGAKTGTVTKKGETAFMINHKRFYEDGFDYNIAELLLKSGSDINAVDESGDTALHYSVSVEFGPDRTYKRKRDVKFLVAAGADTNRKDRKGLTPLARIAMSPDIWAYFMKIRSGQKALAGILIGKGSAVNSRNIIGETPLFGSSFWDKGEFVSLLLKNGADANSINRSGSTALSKACCRDAVDSARRLLAAGADPCRQDANGYNPLHVTALTNSVKTAGLLVSSGSCADARDIINGWTPLMIASVRLNREAVVLLSRDNRSVKNRDRHGRTALMLAASSRLWIKKLPTDFCYAAGRDGESRVDQAVIARILVEAGSDVGAVDADGNTAVDYAVKYGSPGVADYLKKITGADRGRGR
jgi:ankyrin repeat protein